MRTHVISINLDDYGRKGKGATRTKGKGKGKRSERNQRNQSDMYRNQAEEAEDTDEEYKPKSGKGSWRRSIYSWDRPSSSKDTGNYRRPAGNRADYAGPKDRPDNWWNARDFEDYDPRFAELVQDSTRSRRENDRHPEGRHTRQPGRGLDDPALFFTCKNAWP